MVCAQRHRAKLAGHDGPTQPHAAKVKAAGGLSVWQLGQLLKLWKSEGRTCTYCGGACEQVDHVRPLTRGGSSEMDNLAPACRRCNSSKNNRLVSEWFDGTPRVVTPTVLPPRRALVPKPAPVVRVCLGCGVALGSGTRNSGKRYRCTPCAKRFNRQSMRERYQRVSVGVRRGGSQGQGALW